MKALFLSATLLLSLSCEMNKAPASENGSWEFNEGATISKENILAIKKKYQGTHLSTNPVGDNDPYWTPQVLLKELNPWFEVGTGLKEAKLISGSYLIYELKKLPEELLQEMKNSLLDKEYTLALISFPFWKQVKEAQKKGIKVGFISSSSPKIANGVYFRDLNLIAIYTMASSGTFPHEMRHAEQFKKINKYFYPEVLSSSCLSSMSTAFGEIDATTIELGLHSLKVDQLDELFIDSRNFKNNQFPEHTSLYVNLDYPASVSFSAKNNEQCPEMVRKEMEALNSYFSEKGELISTAFTNAMRFISDKGKRLIWIDKNCTNQSSNQCSEYEARIAEIESEYITSKKHFKELIEDEVIRRPMRIKETLEHLDNDVLSDLCNGALGVANYINCKDL